jgi:hypothetical protein
MNSRWLKLTLRGIAVIFLVFAAVRLATDSLSSFHTETHATTGDWFIIDHTFSVNHFTIISGLGGILLFALSFLASRKHV